LYVGEGVLHAFGSELMLFLVVTFWRWRQGKTSLSR